MKLWIPKCGDAVRLDSDWTFTLYDEYRNIDVFDKLVTGYVRDNANYYNTPRKTSQVTLTAGTELVFDRIYIRQNNDEYASVTFMVKDSSIDDLVGDRFWVKLDDANTMELTFTNSDNAVGGFAKAQYKAARAAQKNPELLVKKAKAKESKDELQAVREHVMSRCNGYGSEEFSPHVQNIIDAVCKDLQVTNSWFNSYYRDDQKPAAIRNIMTSGRWRRGSNVPFGREWMIENTKKEGDKTIRRLRFTNGQSVYGGFTVTTESGKITHVEALT